MDTVYLDNAATTQLDKDVISAMHEACKPTLEILHRLMLLEERQKQL